MIIQRSRASIVLFDFLSIHKNKRPFILPINICPVVPLMFYLKGIPFEFIDIDRNTLCLNEELVLEKIKKKSNSIGGVLFSHSYGTSYAPESFFKEIKSINSEILIIDDKCLCQPELEVANRLNKDLILFSTGNSKIVNMGHGGYGFAPNNIVNILSNSNKIKQEGIDIDELSNKFKMKLLNGKNYPFEKEVNIAFPSQDISWKQYQGQICSSLKINDNNRQAITNIYKQNLNSGICLDDDFQKWRFNIISDQKDKILKELFANNLFASSHYQPLTKSTNQHLYPNAFGLYNKIVNLFIDKSYTPAKAEKTVTIINNLLQS